MTTVGDWGFGAVMRRVRNLRGRSPAELRERIAQTVAAELERRGWSSTVGALVDPWEAIAPVAAWNRDAEALRSHFKTRSQPQFFAGVRDHSAAAALNSPEWRREREALIAAAERVLDEKFDLLGHAGLSFGSPIDWHFDPVSGKRAPRTHWSRIPYLDASIVGDHKVIWEINRHQQFGVLGRAFQVTRDRRYADRFAQHVTSWMDENPPKQGINWASSLEIAYRAIAWVWTIELFRDSDALTPSLLLRMLSFLEVHALHLERYLSTYFSPNTHLTGEALGLLYLGCMLPELEGAERWKERGWRILGEQIGRQVYRDGVYFEQATYYHRYTVDIYLHAVILAERNGWDVPGAIRERLTLAAKHLAAIARPDGTIPIIGDDDGGRLAVLETREFADVRAALAASTIVLGVPIASESDATEEVIWLLGPEAARTLPKAPVGDIGAKSEIYAEGGYAVMRRGSGTHALHAVIDCGPLGAMNCGHAHADALAMEVWANGCPLLVDPGTYTYTGSLSDRDLFRHSSMHNTVTVDGEPSSVPAGPFSWAYRTDARLDRWWSSEHLDYFAGSHSGFARISPPGSHSRQVLFVKGGYWIVVDRVELEGEHKATAHWHWALGASVAQRSGREAYVEATCGEGHSGLFFAVAGDVTKVAWEEAWVSPSYGGRALAPVARVESRGSGTRIIVSLLHPMRAEGKASFAEVPAETGRAMRVDRPHGSDHVLIGVNGRARADGIELEGDLAWIRRSAAGQVDAAAVFGQSGALRMDGLELLGVRDGCVGVRTRDGWSTTGGGVLRERVAPTSISIE